MEYQLDRDSFKKELSTYANDLSLRYRYVQNILNGWQNSTSPMSDDDLEFIKKEFGKYGIDYDDITNGEFVSDFTTTNGKTVPLIFGEYYEQIQQYKDNPELYNLLLNENPYLNTSDIGASAWDNFGDSWGFRTNRDKLINERVQNAFKWLDEQLSTFKTNQENTPVSQVQENALAGINSDLLGNDNVESKIAPDLGTIPAQQFPDSNANALNAISTGANAIFSAISTVGNLSASLSAVRLNNAQIHKLESETLSLNTDHVFDWYLRNLDYKPVEQIAKALKEQKILELGRELTEAELKQVEMDAYESHIKSSLSSSDWLPARLQGYSKQTQDSVKNILSTLNPDSTYVKGKIASYQKQLMSDNVDIAQNFAHPYYNEDTLAMAAFYRPIASMQQELFNDSVAYNNKLMQFDLDYVNGLESLNKKLANGEITDEEYQSLSFGQKQSYLRLVEVEQMKAQLNAREIQNKYISEMMKNVKDLEGKEGFERFWAQAQSWISQLLMQTSMGGINLGVNGGLNFGFNRSQSQNSFISLSDNHNFLNQ